METLNPVQRVAVIAIGLALTLLVAMFFLPWAWKQISEWLPAAVTDSLGYAPLAEFVPTVTELPLRVVWSHRATVSNGLFAVLG